MKNHLRSLTLSTLAFAFAPLAHAATVTVFDSSVNSWSATSQYSSSTSPGVTTIATNNTANQSSNWGTDYFNVSGIQDGSGIWTLQGTINAHIVNDNGPSLNQIGFGNISNTNNSLYNTVYGPTPYNTGGPYVLAQRSLSPNQTTDGGVLISGHPSGVNYFAPLLLVQDKANNTQLSETGATTIKLVLNTNTAGAWTLQYFAGQNGTLNPMKFNEYTGYNASTNTYTGLVASDVTTLTYGVDPALPTQIGISALNDVGAPTDFYNITLTDTVTSAVPEPSTWAMMVLGFAGLGFLAYRRNDRKGGLNFRLV